MFLLINSIDSTNGVSRLLENNRHANNRHTKLSTFCLPVKMVAMLIALTSFLDRLRVNHETTEMKKQTTTTRTL